MMEDRIDELVTWLEDLIKLYERRRRDLIKYSKGNKETLNTWGAKKKSLMKNVMKLKLIT